MVKMLTRRLRDCRMMMAGRRFARRSGGLQGAESVVGRNDVADIASAARRFDARGGEFHMMRGVMTYGLKFEAAPATTGLILRSELRAASGALSCRSVHSKSDPRTVADEPAADVTRREVKAGSTALSGGEAESHSAPALGAGKSSADEAESAKESGTLTWSEGLRDRRKLWKLIKRTPRDLYEWGKHFWSGCKLLAADVRVAWKILKRILNGKELSRRERNLLVSTGADLARLVPFSFFVIVPFMEFALPFALKIFPSMLPSQFQDKMKKEEDLKRQLKSRLELAKYLQDVVEEKAKIIKASSSKDDRVKEEAAKLTQFLEDLRAGKNVHERDVLYFARLFSDEYTIEGAVRPQLVAMCKYMGISPYGSDAFLRVRLRARLASIKQDDMQISWEGGVDSLTDDELSKACRERGIRTAGISKRRMRAQLADWLELSQNKEVPGSLMIISRAFFYTEIPQKALKETLSSLPQDVLDDVRGATQSEGKMTTEERLDEVRRQEKLLEVETAREKRLEAEKRKKEVARKEKEERGADEVASAARDADEAAAPATPSEAAGWPEKPDVAAIEAELETEVFQGSAHGESGERGASADTEAAAAAAETAQTEAAPEPLDAAAVEATKKEIEAVQESLKHAADTTMAFVGESAASAESGAAPSADAEKASEGAGIAEEPDMESVQQNAQLVARRLLGMMDASAVSDERLALEQLKTELREASARLDGAPEDSQIKKLRKMVIKLEREIERVDTAVGVKMKLLDSDNDGVVRPEEIRAAVNLVAQNPDLQRPAEAVMARLLEDRNTAEEYASDDLRKSLRGIIADDESQASRSSSGR